MTFAHPQYLVETEWLETVELSFRAGKLHVFDPRTGEAIAR